MFFLNALEIYLMPNGLRKRATAEISLRPPRTPLPNRSEGTPRREEIQRS
jgi:hypothetical protein